MKKKIIIASLVFVSITLLMWLKIVEPLDHWIYHFLVSLQQPYLIFIASSFSFFASPLALLSLTLLLIFLLPSNRERKVLVLDLIICALVIIISKNLFMRTRPELGQILESYSYPSGHAFASVMYYGFLYYLLNNSAHNHTLKRVGKILLGILLVTISLSRLILGVHYMSDVLAGTALGVIGLQFIIYRYEHLPVPSKETDLRKSMAYAFQGIRQTIKSERNMIIHILIAFLVVFAGIFFQINLIEWCICFLLFGLVFALELVNTAIENVVDLVTSEHKKKAKLAKDAAAGAVLIAAIMAVVVGLCIFLPKIM